MHRSFAALTFAALAACSAEQVHAIRCATNEPTFAIEQVSALESSYRIAGGSDAVTLTEDPSKNPPGSIWSVSTVDVLVMIPDDKFAPTAVDQTLAVDVWDGTSATATQPWVVTQTLDPNQITWEQVHLQTPSGGKDFHRGWMHFDFRPLIPDSGMTSTSFMVAVHWPNAKSPLVGSSNYNRACPRTWTDFNDGIGWRDNGITNKGDNCCWPMLNVNTQVVTLKASCDGT